MVFIKPRSNNESVLPFEASTVESSRILVAKVPESAICFERLVAMLVWLVVILVESADSAAVARETSAAKPALAVDSAPLTAEETVVPSKSSLPANVEESATSLARLVLIKSRK